MTPQTPHTGSEVIISGFVSLAAFVVSPALENGMRLATLGVGIVAGLVGAAYTADKWYRERKEFNQKIKNSGKQSS